MRSSISNRNVNISNSTSLEMDITIFIFNNFHLSYTVLSTTTYELNTTRSLQYNPTHPHIGPIPHQKLLMPGRLPTSHTEHKYLDHFLFDAVRSYCVFSILSIDFNKLWISNNNNVTSRIRKYQPVNGESGWPFSLISQEFVKRSRHS